jgi:hypothetical protein
MTPKEFAIRLRKGVVEENTLIYRDLFSGTPVEKASDAYWRRAIKLFAALSKEQKEVFFEVIRQVTVDTTSNILGVIDGVSTLEDVREELELSLGRDRISGDLQSLFLAEEERSAK